jgi:esterase/lipase superfamily enzyme
MSGLYDIKRFTDGYSDDNVYFNNPMDFIQHEHESGRLAALRRMDIILAVGRDDPLRGESERLSGVAMGQGDRQRAAAVGRLGARLALLAADAALLYRGA